MKKTLYCLMGLGGMLFAEIQPVPFTKPAVLLSPLAKELRQIVDRNERVKILSADHKHKREERHFFTADDTATYRAALPVIFEWKCTAGEVGPFTVVISENQDFSESQLQFAKKNNKNEWLNVAEFGSYYGNFKVGCKYYWKVCGYKSAKEKDVVVESPVMTFETEDMAPRWIKLEGTTGNFRDLGGWRTKDGRRVKQGLAFRCQGLNHNSMDGKVVGRKRLTLADRDYVLNVLKMKTDLDLRSDRETAKMTVSPVDPSVQFIHHSSACYAGIHTTGGKEVMAKNFRVFCDINNYPIVFHCIGGADRTGSLAWILNGLLGVEERYLSFDWESTFYPRLPDDRPDFSPTYWCRYQSILDGIYKYGGEDTPLQVRIELYLKDCGITDEEIATFRKIMLE